MNFILYLCRRRSQIIVIKREKKKQSRYILFSNKLLWFSEFQLHVRIHIDWLHCKSFDLLLTREEVRKKMSFFSSVSPSAPLIGFVSLTAWCFFFLAQLLVFWFLIPEEQFEIRSKAQIKELQSNKTTMEMVEKMNKEQKRPLIVLWTRRARSK